MVAVCALLAGACGGSPAKPSAPAALPAATPFASAAFIVSKGGLVALTDLMRSNGDVGAALRLSQAEFERDWFALVRARYGF